MSSILHTKVTHVLSGIDNAQESLSTQNVISLVEKASLVSTDKAIFANEGIVGGVSVVISAQSYICGFHS